MRIAESVGYKISDMMKVYAELSQHQIFIPGDDIMKTLVTG